MEAIGQADAIIYKVQTLLDGGVRVTLDLDNSSTQIAMKLMEMKGLGEELVSVGFARIE